MATKIVDAFYTFDRSLLPATIKQADDKFVKPELLQDCTVVLAPSPSVGVGDSVRLHLTVEGVVGILTNPILITDENVGESIIWQVARPSYGKPDSGASVSTGYYLEKSDGEKLKGTAGRYTVR